jgi:hypothetical protein
MEEEMRVLSQAEIARCTKSELHALLRVIASELPQLAKNSPELRINERMAQRLGDKVSRHYIENHLAETYVLCFSCHEPNDNDGLLSMWRGYGGNGNGAAIVIDTAKINVLPTSSLILAHVEYATAQARRDWLVALVTKFSGILAALNLPAGNQDNQTRPIMVRAPG